MIAVDENDDGELSLEEVRREQLGVGEGLIGFSLYSGSVAPEWSGTLGETETGMCIYSDRDSPGRVTSVDEREPFRLNLCSQGDIGCQPPISRLFCSFDCDRDWGLNRLGL